MRSFRFLLQPLILTFALLTAGAAAEAVLLGTLVGKEQTYDAVANAGGPQRMRTQRIAYLTEVAVDPGLSAAERAELATAIDAFRTGQLRLDGNAQTRVGTADGAQTNLIRDVNAYADAAAAVLAHPANSAGAHAYLTEHRLALLEELDAAVEAKKSAEDRDIRALWIGVCALVGIMAVLVFASWGWIVLPLQRHLATSRQQLRVLFKDNPTAVFTYDLDGVAQTANAAALKLLGDPKPSRSTFDTYIKDDDAARAAAAFERAATGDVVELEAGLVQASGASIDAVATLLPQVVDGRIVGVTAIARDVSDVRRGERALREQSERIRDLVLVAAASGESEADQIKRALELGCRRLGFPVGFIARLEGHTASIESLATLGDDRPAFDQNAITIDEAALARWIEAADVRSFDAADAPDWATESSGRLAQYASFVIAPIRVRGTLYGGIGFADTAHHERPSSEDRDFVRLIGALAGVAIERGLTQKKLDALAFSDTLTGLPNRASLEQQFETIRAAADRSGKAFAVHFVDLDGFKEINDRLGHDAGDAVLRVVAGRLVNALGPDDTVARFGGDEFVVLQGHVENDAEAEDVARRLLAAVSEPILISGTTQAVGASSGIATYPGDGKGLQALLRAADAALYRAKGSGRGTVAFARSLETGT